MYSTTLPLAATTTFAHPKMSDRYAHVTSSEIADVLQQDGWRLDSGQQARTHGCAGNEAHTKHLLRFSHPEIGTRERNSAEGGIRPQVILYNASNGTSALRMGLGLYRFVCANGIATGEQFSQFRVTHRGSNLTEQVVAHAATLRQSAHQMLDVIDRWRATKLAQADLAEFAAAAIRLRAPDAEMVWTQVSWNPETAPRKQHVAAAQFIRPTRPADAEDNLWNVFNRAQESLINGRYRTIKPVGEDDWKASTVRRLSGLGRSLRLNQDLWDLATEMDLVLN